MHLRLYPSADVQLSISVMSFKLLRCYCPSFQDDLRFLDFDERSLKMRRVHLMDYLEEFCQDSFEEVRSTSNLTQNAFG